MPVTARRSVKVLLHSRVWRRGHGRLLLRQITDRERNRRFGYTDEEHLQSAAMWLARAQDVAGDGGVAGRYRLRSGWSSSYPETTGYMIPTLLSLAKAWDDAGFYQRARRAVDFLLSIQLSCGGFPAGEIGENRTDPSVFNTGQILHGLVRWHGASGDPDALDAARRAAEWILSVQAPDGSFGKHFYRGVASAYCAHATCRLAELGAVTGEGRYLRSAGRHLNWTLSQRDPETGWIDRCGFSRRQHESRIALTHTIAYTLDGILKTSERLNREDGIAAVRAAAERMARRLELDGWLPGILDAGWRPRCRSACLTGNAQTALLWFRLYELDSDGRFLNAALKAIDLVKQSQPMESGNVNLRGGIPGSDPIWGEYITMALPNWAAKFFIDALLKKRAILAGLKDRRPAQWTPPSNVPRKLPPAGPPTNGRPLRVVLYTKSTSRKPAAMLRQWACWGFRPEAIVVESRGPQPWGNRLRRKVAREGLGAFIAPGRRRSASNGRAEILPDPATLGEQRGIPVVAVDSLESREGQEAVRELRPDLAIHAGAGILRSPLLEIPTLGTINAHMGLLPRYRGMNVTEWSVFHGDPVGCSVHLISPGIDTGAILCVRRIDVSAARSLDECRELVNAGQLALLGEVVRSITATGHLPPVRSQRDDEGRQFFRMHPELRSLVDAEFRRPQAGARGLRYEAF